MFEFEQLKPPNQRNKYVRIKAEYIYGVKLRIRQKMLFLLHFVSSLSWAAARCLHPQLPWISSVCHVLSSFLSPFLDQINWGDNIQRFRLLSCLDCWLCDKFTHPAAPLLLLLFAILSLSCLFVTSWTPSPQIPTFLPFLVLFLLDFPSPFRPTAWAQHPLPLLSVSYIALTARIYRNLQLPPECPAFTLSHCSLSQPFPSSPSFNSTSLLLSCVLVTSEETQLSRVSVSRSRGLIR